MAKKDMQDDLRKMIERLLKQEKGPIRKRPIKGKDRQIGIDVGPFPDSPRRRRPRPMPMPKPRGPKDDGRSLYIPKPMPKVLGPSKRRPRPMPRITGPSRKIKPRPMPKRTDKYKKGI